MKLLLTLVLLVSACGGSTTPEANCSPATYRACVPTGPHGCDLYEVGTVVVAAASCSGGDSHDTCQPSSTLECVHDCSSYSDCANP
jgi:hypothetical protein